MLAVDKHHVGLTELDRFGKGLLADYPLTGTLAGLFYARTLPSSWESTKTIGDLSELPLRIAGDPAELFVNNAIWNDLRYKGINCAVAELLSPLLKVAVGDGILGEERIGGFQIVLRQLIRPVDVEALQWAAETISAANRAVSEVVSSNSIKMVDFTWFRYLKGFSQLKLNS